MFGTHSDNGYSAVSDGIRIKTIAYGERTLMTEFVLSANSVLPEHAHVHEQIGYLVRGKIRLYVGGQDQIVTDGGSWCIPSNVAHRAEIIDDSIAIEVFCPCREEYKKYAHSEDIRNDSTNS